MDDLELGARFSRQRPQLRAVAYRILGSLNEADDAVQEGWLRLERTDAGQIDSSNVGGASWGDSGGGWGGGDCLEVACLVLVGAVEPANVPVGQPVPVDPLHFRHMPD